MKFSLKTKFYLYVLPLAIILPILLYSLAAPYSQMRTIFTNFQTNADIAITGETVYQNVEAQELELLHYATSLSAVDFKIYKGRLVDAQTQARKNLETLYQQQNSSIGEESDLSQEKDLLSRINTTYAQLNMQTSTVISLINKGGTDNASDVMRGQMDDLITNSLKPALEQFVSLKEDEVQNSLPLLVSIIQRFGVIPVPGIQQSLNTISISLEHAIDVQNLSRLIDDQQIEVFHQILGLASADETPTELQVEDKELSGVQGQIATLFKELKSEFSSKDAHDMKQLAAVQNIQKQYNTFSTLAEQTIVLAKQNQKEKALDSLAHNVDGFVGINLDPTISHLVIINRQDVIASISNLNNGLNILVIVIYTICFLVFLMGVVSIVYLSKTIISPILVLRDATGKIIAGDFTTRVAVTSNDEIGQLAASFNTMTSKLQSLYKELEAKVTQRTDELSAKVAELENGKKATLNILEDLNVEKTKSEERKNILSSFLENMPIGAALLEAPTGKITMINKTGTELLGRGVIEGATKEKYTQAYDLLKSDGSAYPLEENPAAVTLATGKDCMKNDMFVRKPNGEQINIRVTTSPIKNQSGEMIFVVSVFEDVTKEQEVDRMKTEFISIASHELRTPMTAIRGLISMIFEGDYGVLPDGLKPPLSDITTSADRLIALVNDLLNVSRIEAGRMSFLLEDMRLDEVIRQVIAMLQPLAIQKTLQLKSEYIPPIVVQADGSKVQQILNNIFGNALKFTETGGITVSVKQEGQMITVYIVDTGIGISKENQTKLFGKFQQVGSQKAGRPAGTGLGLYISRELVRKMGGELWIEKSEPGVGTTFAFSLPLAKSQKADTIKNTIAAEAAMHPDQK